MNEKDYLFMLNQMIEDLEKQLPSGVIIREYDEGFYSGIVRSINRIKKDIALIEAWIKQE